MEKLIDLTNTTNYIINLDEDQNRLNQSMIEISKLGIEAQRFPAVKHTLGIIGCGSSHYKLLHGMGENTLVLEDDVCSLSSDKTIWSVPEEADAIYFGISNHGYIRNSPYGHKGVVLATQYNKNYKRVFNMCSTHAILYISKTYIDAAKDIVLKSLKENIPFDVGLASIHRNFNILTPNSPLFFQRDQPEFTNFELEV